jgi:hypothetical protein
MKASLIVFIIIFSQTVRSEADQNLIAQLQNHHPEIVEQKTVLRSANDRNYQKHISQFNVQERVNLDKATQLILRKNLNLK